MGIVQCYSNKYLRSVCFPRGTAGIRLLNSTWLAELDRELPAQAGQICNMGDWYLGYVPPEKNSQTIKLNLTIYNKSTYDLLIFKPCGSQKCMNSCPLPCGSTFPDVTTPLPAGTGVGTIPPLQINCETNDGGNCFFDHSHVRYSFYLAPDVEVGSFYYDTETADSNGKETCSEAYTAYGPVSYIPADLYSSCCSGYTNSDGPQRACFSITFYDPNTYNFSCDINADGVVCQN